MILKGLGVDKFELETAFKEDGKPFISLDTYHVRHEGRLIGTIQRMNDKAFKQDLWLAWSHPDVPLREGDPCAELANVTARAGCKWLLDQAREADKLKGQRYRAEHGAIHEANHSGYVFTVDPPRFAEDVARALNIETGEAVWLRDAGGTARDGQWDSCWVPCAKGDPGAVRFVKAE